MLFNSTEFLFFFPIVLMIYFLIPPVAKLVWLLLASYFFYACWNPKYLSLILFTTVVTYLVGRGIAATDLRKKKKIILGMGITAVLSVLLVFKYLDFIFLNCNRLLKLASLREVTNPFQLLLPVGISFFTFQAVGYVIDVYRGDVQAEKNIVKYALFVSFFPQLVAGPIERSKNLLSQIDELGKKRLWTRENLTSGLGTMLWGFFMKMVIADRAAIFVNNVYDNLYAAGTVETVFAAVGFSIQIYADFAGYSAIAIGAARMIGIHLMENFDTPYFSMSIGEFWRRWHVSLSTWFRDYLYIPLGGNRGGRWKKYRNLMATFLASGLWHGAAWKYVAWGAIHGLYQIVGDLVAPLRKKVEAVMEVKTDTWGYRGMRMLGTFALTTFAWIFFRAESLTTALGYIRRMFTKWNPWVLFDDSIYGWGLDHFEMNILMTGLFLLLVVSLVRRKRKLDAGQYLMTENAAFRWAVYIFLALFILTFGEYGIAFDSNQFIYFDF